MTNWKLASKVLFENKVDELLKLQRKIEEVEQNFVDANNFYRESESLYDLLEEYRFHSIKFPIQNIDPLCSVETAVKWISYERRRLRKQYISENQLKEKIEELVEVIKQNLMKGGDLDGKEIKGSHGEREQAQKPDF
jgi:hypothetical protein